jgi:cell wall-associated NlpC family hydrolase
VTVLENQVDLNNSVLVKQQLLGQYNEWRGSRYKSGGLSRQGVDCSGFVYVTFLSKLGFEIPRTTELQLKIGFDVAKTNLRAGDLIFFKTGFFTRHIGIYLGNGQFIHASSSHGVTKSSLHNKYWQSKYWLSRRLET